ACPPGRSDAAFSTTVTSKPLRPSPRASAGPAILAPESRTSMTPPPVALRRQDTIRHPVHWTQLLSGDLLADAARLLSTPPAPAKRGPKPRYTLHVIADAALAIADEHGLEAVTMQQVAAHLGTTKMALYRYLPGRAELDAVMLDR